MDAIDRSKFDWRPKKKSPDITEAYYKTPSGKQVLAGWIKPREILGGQVWDMFKDTGEAKGFCDTPHEAQAKIEALFLRLYNRQYHGA